jgi:3-deoxy-D-manno-octulosonic acid kinase
MTQDGGQRIATAAGAMLADRARLGNAAGLAMPDERIFEPQFWAARGELSDVTRGRGSAWFIAAPPDQWALRHYRRGGLIARVFADRYLWRGEARVRAFAEWRLLATLVRRGLPVPAPVAARYQRAGPWYRCDLITRRIPGALPLSVRLEREALGDSRWRDIGATVARLHAAGVDHADLNAHNLLLDDAGAVSVIDFDRGRLHPPAPTAAATTPLAQRCVWATRNLARLQRSLRKIAHELPPARCGEREWQWLLEGYAGAPAL